MGKQETEQILVEIFVLIFMIFLLVRQCSLLAVLYIFPISKSILWRDNTLQSRRRRAEAHTHKHTHSPTHKQPYNFSTFCCNGRERRLGDVQFFGLFLRFRFFFVASLLFCVFWFLSCFLFLGSVLFVNASSIMRKCGSRSHLGWLQLEKYMVGSVAALIKRKYSTTIIQVNPVQLRYLANWFAVHTKYLSFA